MPFQTLANKLIKDLDPLTIFVEFAKQREVNDNTVNAIKKRLYAKGITGDGVKLQTDKSRSGEVYADLTIILKELSGDPDNRVTLKDTGEFYDKMVTVITKTYYEVTSDFEKDDGHMQENFKQEFSNEDQFEESVMSLTEKEIINIFIDEFTIYYTKKINEKFTV